MPRHVSFTPDALGHGPVEGVSPAVAPSADGYAGERVVGRGVPKRPLRRRTAGRLRPGHRGSRPIPPARRPGPLRGMRQRPELPPPARGGPEPDRPGHLRRRPEGTGPPVSRRRRAPGPRHRRGPARGCALPPGRRHPGVPARRQGDRPRPPASGAVAGTGGRSVLPPGERRRHGRPPGPPRHRAGAGRRFHRPLPGGRQARPGHSLLQPLRTRRTAPGKRVHRCPSSARPPHPARPGTPGPVVAVGGHLPTGLTTRLPRVRGSRSGNRRSRRCGCNRDAGRGRCWSGWPGP